MPIKTTNRYFIIKYNISALKALEIQNKKKHIRTGPTILKFKQNKTLDYCEYVCMQNLLTKEQRNKSKQRVGILTRVVENNQ